ncbi:MAG: lipoprotein, partial [Tidjanibacter sp.]|nr:lipoprotein [Tidjanibacter sp.]
MKKLLIIIVGLFVLTSCDIEFPFMPDFDVNNENSCF